MDAKVYSIQGEEIRTIQLDDAVFGREPSEGTIYHAIRNELANRRVGTSSTKTRSEVNGSTTKPWKQKGTGRARAGRRKSPLWTGGGIIFGPKPRDYSYSMPRKMKRLAMKSILSRKVKEGRLKVIEDFSIESGKTKDMATILKALVSSERTVVILKDDDRMIRRAGSNIPWLSFLSYNRLAAHQLFYSRNVLLLEGAAGKLSEFYSDGQKAEVE